MTDIAQADVQTRLATAMKQAAAMTRTAEVLIPLLAAAIALPLIGNVYLALAEDRGGAIGALAHVLEATPAICAAMAVTALCGVIGEYAAGRMLSAKASTGFRRAGYWALAAFLLKVAIVPVALALLSNAAFAWRFDPLNIALMAFAALVLMIGTVLETAAAALKAENDQIV